VNSSPVLFQPLTPSLLPNLAVLTKAEEQCVFPDLRHAADLAQHHLHLFRAIQYPHLRALTSETARGKHTALRGKQCPLPLHPAPAALHHRLWKPCCACLNFPLPWSQEHSTMFCTAAQIQRDRGARPCSQPDEQAVEKLFILSSVLPRQTL